MEPTRKELLATRFVEWPLIQVLIFNPWFRWIFLAAVLGMLLIGVSLLRVWRTSPPDFVPIVRVSWLDLAQARSLKRSALKLAAAGKDNEAAYAWQAAIANNMADPELIRGALRHTVLSERLQPRLMGQSVAETFWLLRLTQTNQADLDLTVEIFDRYNLSEYMVKLLAPREGNLTPAQEAAYLRAMFMLGKMEQFGARWKQVSPKIKEQPELATYYAAYQVGWGPPETLTEGKQRLAAAAEDPKSRILASRLQLYLCTRMVDVSGYAEALRRLEQWHADGLPDRIGYWQLLLSVGRRAEARQLAENYLQPPVLPWEVVRLAQAYISLGMQDYTRRFLRRYAPEFGNSDVGWAFGIWAVYADLLIETRQWEELLSMALLIRTLDNVQSPLAAFSHFMEGRALYSQNYFEQAVAAFQRAAQLPFNNPLVALQAGTSLLRMGYAGIAWEVLLPVEPDLKDNGDYWQTLFEAAYAQKEPVVMFKAAARAYELLPKNAAAENNYAAALLISRQRPEEASKITLNLLTRSPDSAVAKINHSFALTMNHRATEAAAVLRTVNPARLNELETTMYYLNLFEIHFEQQQFDQARDDLGRINLQHLFPNQVKWLEEKRGKLPAPAGKASG